MKKFAVFGVVAILGIVMMVSGRAPVTAQDAKPAARQIVQTHELMEILYERPYKDLKAAMQKPPSNRQGWKTIFSAGNSFAELSNLLYVRQGEPYMGTDVWAAAAAANQKTAEALAAAAKTQNFAEVKTAYEAMIKSCNTCHEEFEPDVAPILNPYGEDQ